MSWRVFVPLGRLNYCVYLINLNYFLFYSATSRTAYYYTFMGFCQFVFGAIAFVYVFALVTWIAVEAPFLNLERLIFSRGQFFFFFFFF